MRTARLLSAAVLLAGLATTAAWAEDTVRIGAVYALSGPTAGAGVLARTVIEIGVGIVNNNHEGLENLPLATGWGLRHLGGAKIAVEFADDFGNPSVAQSQALRLIEHDRVAALIGGGPSSAALAAAAVAARRGVPFLLADAVAPAAPPAAPSPSGGRVFFTDPLAADIAASYANFLGAAKAAGAKLETVAIVHPDKEAAEAGALRDALAGAGFTVGDDILYRAGAVDLSAPVQRLREARPDVAILIGSRTDAALLIKTMKTFDDRPPLVIGDDDGFSQPGFVAAAGNLAQGLVDRSVWSAGKPGSATAIIADMYRTRTGRDLDDASARTLQGFFVLADAIDRAGTTDPAAVAASLQQTDLAAAQLVVGYRGIRFDASGRNTLGSTYLTQLQDRSYVTIWPEAAATAKPFLPYRGWR